MLINTTIYRKNQNRIFYMGEFFKSPQIPLTTQGDIVLQHYLKVSLVFLRTLVKEIDYFEVILLQTTAN